MEETMYDILWRHTPFAVKPKRPAKTHFIYPFTSHHSQEAVLRGLVEGLEGSGYRLVKTEAEKPAYKLPDHHQND